MSIVFPCFPIFSHYFPGGPWISLATGCGTSCQLIFCDLRVLALVEVGLWSLGEAKPWHSHAWPFYKIKKYQKISKTYGNIGQYWKSWNILGNFGKECRNMLKIAEICRIMQKHAEYFKIMEHFYHVTAFHHSIVFQCDLWNSLEFFGYLWWLQGGNSSSPSHVPL